MIAINQARYSGENERGQHSGSVEKVHMYNWCFKYYDNKSAESDYLEIYSWNVTLMQNKAAWD